ncbi:hypothetical protein [Parasitella parasitica]|uniref:Uncharacterized protein n=1 Tax=Parasitella parasitica TaxID=35722 RepID=A0A0B7NVV7_9FUNG|nr:hypothetical protein [Parasitella parasitica]
MQRYHSQLETQHNSFNFPATINRSKRQHTNKIVYITTKANETLPDFVEYHHECPVSPIPAILPAALSSSTSPTSSTSTEKSHQAKTVPVKRQEPDDDDVDGPLEKEQQLDGSGYSVYPLTSDDFGKSHPPCPGRVVHFTFIPSSLPNDLASFFTDADIVATLRCIQSKYKLTRRDSMPLDLMKSMVEILDNLDNHLIDLDAAIFQYYYQFDSQIACNTALDEGLRKMEQNTRFVDPLLCGLFDDPSQGVFFRWLDERAMDVKKKDILTNMHPDITIAMEWHH